MVDPRHDAQCQTPIKDTGCVCMKGCTICMKPITPKAYKTTRQEVFDMYERLVNLVDAVIHSDEDVQERLTDLAFAIVDPNADLVDIHGSEVFGEELVKTEAQIMARVFAELIKKTWWPFGNPDLVSSPEDRLEVNSGIAVFTKEAVG